MSMSVTPESSPQVQRQVEPVVQRAGGGDEANGDLESRLNASKGGGSPLAPEVRAFMEPRFGADFSGVRVHTDGEAVQMNRELGAQAFAHGSDVYFGEGKSPGNNELTAHELTHVVQQGGGHHLQSQSNRDEAVTPQQLLQQIERREDDTNPFAQKVTPVSSSAILQTNREMIQRAANWSVGAVNESINLARAFVTGGPAGVTPPMLNGSVCWSAADAQRSLQPPTLAFASSSSGGVEAQVATVPTNTGSFDATVLAPGPWTTVTTKVIIGGQFASLTQCTGAGNTTFKAIGNPSDAVVQAANRRHELHHASDHKTAFDSLILPWDQQLTQAQSNGTVYRGNNEVAATANLYRAMGGTPDQVAASFFNQCVASGRAYHSTPQGGIISQSNPQASADCSTSSAQFTNPS